MPADYYQLMQNLHFWFIEYVPSGGFAAGFVTGQFAILVVLMVFVRLFFLKNPSEPIRIRGEQLKKFATKSAPNLPLLDTSKEILSRLGTDVENLSGESCHWINFLLAKAVFARLHQEPRLLEGIIDGIESTVADLSEYLTGFEVRKFEVNREAFPRFCEMQVKRFYGGLPKALDEQLSEYCIEGRLVWADAGNFEVEAAATVHWPPGHPLIVLPCQLSVNLKHIDARFRLTFPESAVPTNGIDKDGKSLPLLYTSRLDLSLIPDEFFIDLDIGSSIGHRAKLNNVQKISQFLASMIRTRLHENLVWPNRMSIELPVLADLIFPIAL